MAMSEIVLRGGVSEDGLKVVVKDGNDRFLFSVVDDGAGHVTIQDANGNNIGDGGYIKPDGGIPASDLAEAVQTSLGKADTAYQKPADGIPSTDFADAVNTSLGKADTAYQKPADGIPSTDLEKAYLEMGTKPATPASTGKVWAKTYDQATDTFGWTEVDATT